MNDEEQALAEIKYLGPIDVESESDMRELNDLINSIENSFIQKFESLAPKGAKAELLTTLAVIGTATGFVGLVLQAVSIWKSGKKRYSVSIAEGSRTYIVDNLSADEYIKIVKKLKNKKKISINIHRKSDS